MPNTFAVLTGKKTFNTFKPGEHVKNVYLLASSLLISQYYAIVKS